MACDLCVLSQDGADPSQACDRGGADEVRFELRMPLPNLCHATAKPLPFWTSKRVSAGRRRGGGFLNVRLGVCGEWWQVPHAGLRAASQGDERGA